MDLWIRSQNERMLIKTDYIEIGSNNRIYTKDVELGKYKTEQRALEVLDDIEEVINHLDDLKLNVSIFVYRMPEE